MQAVRPQNFIQQYSNILSLIKITVKPLKYFPRQNQIDNVILNLQNSPFLIKLQSTNNIQYSSQNIQKMSMLNRFKETFKKLYERRKEVIEYWNKTPTTKIIMINAGVYCMWKLNIIPEDFLVKHFAAERFNVENGRIHTLVTHAFSHHGIFSLFFDVLMIGFMGKAIQQNFPNKYIYLLYGLGALFGGLSMTVFQRPSPYIHPRIGSESSIAAFITFIGLLNPRQTFVLFVFPMPAWVLLAFLGMYSLIFDPEKKSFAGMTAGLTVYQLMRGKFI